MFHNGEKETSTEVGGDFHRRRLYSSFPSGTPDFSTVADEDMGMRKRESQSRLQPATFRPLEIPSSRATHSARARYRARPELYCTQRSHQIHSAPTMRRPSIECAVASLHRLSQPHDTLVDALASECVARSARKRRRPGGKGWRVMREGFRRAERRLT